MCIDSFSKYAQHSLNQKKFKFNQIKECLRENIMAIELNRIATLNARRDAAQHVQRPWIKESLKKPKTQKEVPCHDMVGSDKKREASEDLEALPGPVMVIAILMAMRKSLTLRDNMLCPVFFFTHSASPGRWFQQVKRKYAQKKPG